MLQFTRSGLMRGIRLGQEIGRGGEGAVFEVEGQKDRVAKIYSSPPDRGKVQKLIAMAEAANLSLLKIAAWPDTLLRDNEGVVRGFTMPRAIARRDIHELYTPKSRLKTFPGADFRFLVHVAANVARAFAVVHEQGHVVGDVNHGNLLVGTNGTVMFIDCDSFQVGNGATVFTCDVGSPLFTAPELQGRPFRGLLRSANHDRFGLAVILFHLLFMGRHPFLGGDSDAGYMPPDKAIAKYRFPYGPNGVWEDIERPPNTVPLEAMGEDVARLFIWAFGRAGGNGVRPNSKTWIEALEKLRYGLRVCSRTNWHYYSRESPACPWCPIEWQTGVGLFGKRVIPVGSVAVSELDTLWNAIRTVPDPGSNPRLPSERPWHLPPGIVIPNRRLRVFRKVFSINIGIVFAGFAAYIVPPKDGRIAVAALAFFGLVGAIWPWVSPEEKAATNGAYQEAEAEWKGVLARWQREALRDAFNEKRKSLGDAHAEISQLIRWRQTHERNFQFNQSERVHLRDVEARIRQLLSTLRQGPDDLLRLSQQINMARTRLIPALEKAWDELKIAEARRDAL